MKLLDRPFTAIEDWTRTARLVFTHPQAVDEPPPPPPSKQPWIEFIGYTVDCTVSGRLPLSGDRLSDVLNTNDHLVLVDVLVEELGRADAVAAPEVQLDRDEFLVVHASEPRGRPDRRTRTRQHPIRATLGPYEVRGYVHALPGADPIDALTRRPPMVALTDAVVEYDAGDEHHVRRATTVLINRVLADRIELDAGAGGGLDRIELEIPHRTGRLVKDFTGELIARDDSDVEDEPVVTPGQPPA